MAKHLGNLDAFVDNYDPPRGVNMKKHKTPRMKGKDFVDASKALIAWLESQDIHPSDAPRVLAITLIAMIRVIARREGLDPKEGGRVIASIIKGELE